LKNLNIICLLKTIFPFFTLIILIGCQSNVGIKKDKVQSNGKTVFVVNTSKEIQSPWLAFRSEPKYDGKLIYMLPDGTKLKIIGEDSGGKYVKVEIIDNIGYVSKKFLSDKQILINNSQINQQDKYSKLEGDYKIGTDFFTKHLTLRYLGNNQFSYRINVENCNFGGQFELINNIGIAKNSSCGEITFNFNRIINWIDNQKGDSRYYPISVSVPERNEECIKCYLKGIDGAVLMDIFPWGDYWKVN
jgi:hypothetical protein